MTLKQKAVAKKILENPSKPLGQAMREAGYSENSAIAPTKNLTSSEGWQELMNKYLPDPDVFEVHQQGLKANKIISSHTEPDYEYPDHAIRLKSVDLAYKVKGYYVDKQVNILNNGDMTLEFS